MLREIPPLSKWNNNCSFKNKLSQLSERIQKRGIQIEILNIFFVNKRKLGEIRSNNFKKIAIFWEGPIQLEALDGISKVQNWENLNE